MKNRGRKENKGKKKLERNTVNAERRKSQKQNPNINV